MFDKVKSFYEAHEWSCMIAAGYAVGIAASIPLAKWMYKAMADAITAGINNSNVNRR